MCFYEAASVGRILELLAQKVNGKKIAKRRHTELFTHRLNVAAPRPIVAIRQCAGAEERLADADDGRAFLNGEFEVSRHAHGELAVVERWTVLTQNILDMAKALKAGAHSGFIAGEDRQRHEPPNPQRRGGGKFPGEGKRRVRFKAKFALLARRIDLDEHIEAAPFDLQSPIQRFRDPQPIERLTRVLRVRPG